METAVTRKLIYLSKIIRRGCIKMLAGLTVNDIDVE
jgi:hypothetical protein